MQRMQWMRCFFLAVICVMKSGCAHGYYSYNNYDPAHLNPLVRTREVGTPLTTPVVVPLRISFSVTEGPVYDQLYLTTSDQRKTGLQTMPMPLVEISHWGTAYYSVNYSVRLASDPQTIGVIISTDPAGKNLIAPQQVFEEYSHLSVSSWFLDYDGEDKPDWDSWGINCFDNALGYAFTLSARGQIMDWHTLLHTPTPWRHCDVQYHMY